LRRLHAKACRLAQSDPEIVTHPGVAHAMEQELLHALVNCLAPAASIGRDATRQRHAQILVQWEDVFANHADCPHRMAKLCAVIGVSERTLRAACHDVVGMAPGQYDRLRRLNLVRCELRHANPAITPVSEIAERHGFSELGRFAVLYRRLFGEKPSETLRSAAVLARVKNLPEMHSARSGRRPT
jgi:AraC-like DNA-binding protein